MPFNNRGNAWKAKKMYDKAISDYTEAIKLDPTIAHPHASKAEAHVKLKKYDKAVAGFEKALEINPLVWIQREFAKFRASCPDSKYRDGKKAVELAKQALEAAGKDAHWSCIDVLAMALAETGDFEQAITEQLKAIDRLTAEKSPEKDELKSFEARLELYRMKKPYRDEE